jgi:integrase
MKARFRLFRRNGGAFYCHDSITGKQASLLTRNRAEAMRLLHARNEAHVQPALNLQIARAYLMAADQGSAKRTWRIAADELMRTKHGANLDRWKRAVIQDAFASILDLLVVETRAEHFLHVLTEGTVSTNVFLRRLHNFALDMNWLPASVIPKRQWPKVQHRERRAITLAEHQQILEREGNPERRAFYELCWHLGGSQSDIANLTAEDVDWTQRYISYSRMKTKEVALLHFGGAVAALLERLPAQGPLFPYLRTVRAGDRATEFHQRCRGLGIAGVSLHSYRYAWAERAKQCGYPERFAQVALGHNSKAVHRAYARHAIVNVPPLEDFERGNAGQGCRPHSTPVLAGLCPSSSAI